MTPAGAVTTEMAEEEGGLGLGGLGGDQRTYTSKASASKNDSYHWDNGGLL